MDTPRTTRRIERERERLEYLTIQLRRREQFIQRLEQSPSVDERAALLADLGAEIMTPIIQEPKHANTIQETLTAVEYTLNTMRLDHVIMFDMLTNDHTRGQFIDAMIAHLLWTMGEPRGEYIPTSKYSDIITTSKRAN